MVRLPTLLIMVAPIVVADPDPVAPGYRAS
jgi:hypothetical protein